MRILTRYFILIICLFISSIYFNMLQFPNKIVTGGLAGLAIVINYWFKIEPSNIILIISIITLIVDFLILGKLKAMGAIIATIVYPFFIKITSSINNYVNINLSNLIIISILIGILSGITTGIVYKIGFNNGGLSIVSELISKYINVSLGLSSFIINMIVVLLGGFAIGLKMVFYSLIILFIFHKLTLKQLINLLKRIKSVL